jgi:hypothetical protein
MIIAGADGLDPAVQEQIDPRAGPSRAESFLLRQPHRFRSSGHLPRCFRRSLVGGIIPESWEACSGIRSGGVARGRAGTTVSRLGRPQKSGNVRRGDMANTLALSRPARPLAKLGLFSEPPQQRSGTTDGAKRAVQTLNSSHGYLSPITFERHFAAVTLEPGAHQHAVVLAPVKERPGSIAASRTAGVPAVLDSRSTRRRRKCAGRDGKMLAANQMITPKRRTECGQTGYPRPRLSTKPGQAQTPNWRPAAPFVRSIAEPYAVGVRQILL